MKRAVRQRDGFGCVVCGGAVIEYEHFHPEYADAKFHDPSGIILLCVGCHGLKTRGRLSRETVLRASQHPKAKQTGFSHGAFDVGERCPDVLLGNVQISNIPVLLQVRGDNLLTVKPPEVPGGPFRLSAYLTDRRGRLQLAITDNEWQSPTSNWDVTVIGQRIAIRSGIRDIELIIRTDPPHRIVVERLRMAHRDLFIECEDGKPTIFKVGEMTLATHDAMLNGCQIGIAVMDDGTLAIGVGGGSISLGAMGFGPNTKAAIEASNVVQLFKL